MEVSPVEYAILDTRACATCGYDLRGQVEPRCPECGTAFDPGAIPVPPIPWVTRADADAWGAYWATVGWVLRNPRAAARTIAAARVYVDVATDRFRNAVMWQAVWSVLVIIAASFVREAGDASLPTVAGGLVFAAISFPGAALFFMAVSQAHSLPRAWWSRPILTDHAQAIQYCALAPLALLPGAALLALAAMTLRLGGEGIAAERVHDVMLLVCAGMTGAWWCCTMLMMQASRLWDMRELSVALVLLPVRWLVLAVGAIVLAFFLGLCIVLPIGLVLR